jgi:hypothetical protein
MNMAECPNNVEELQELEKFLSFRKIFLDF